MQKADAQAWQARNVQTPGELLPQLFHQKDQDSQNAGGSVFVLTSSDILRNGPETSTLKNFCYNEIILVISPFGSQSSQCFLRMPYIFMPFLIVFTIVGSSPFYRLEKLSHNSKRVPAYDH